MSLPGGSAALLLARSQLRFAWRNPVSVCSAAVGICLAVVAISAVHLVGKAVRADLAANTAEGLFGYTHVLTASGGIDEAAYFALRQRWRAGELALANVDGMVPVIQGSVRIGDASYALTGLDPLADVRRGRVPAPAAQRDLGDFLASDVVMAPPAVAAMARDADTIAGLPVKVVEQSGAQGIYADLPTAQRLLARPGELDAVWLRVADHRIALLDWLDGLLPGIDAALPAAAAPAVAGFAVSAATRWQPLRRFADATVFLLGMLAILSVFMAAALAAQASLTNAARRRRERERLLALGAAPGTLRWLAMAEGAALGCLATGAGLAVGVGIANWLLDAAQVNANAASIDSWLIGKSLVCGVLVAGALPALADRAAAPSHAIGTPFGRIGFAALAAAAAIAVAGLWHGSLAGAFTALLALALAQVGAAVPALASATQWAAATALARRPARPTLGGLGARATWRALGDRAGEIKLALGALSVAAAVAIAMALMVASLRQDFLTMLAQRLSPGVSVQLPADAPPITAADVDWMRALPGVRAARRYGDVSARLAGGPVQVSFAELDGAETARYGFAGGLAEAAMVNEVGARLHDLGVGDTTTVQAGGVEVAVHIAHVFADYGATQARLIVPLAWRDRFAPAETTSDATGRIAWRRATATAAEADVDALTQVLGERFGAASVRNHEEIRAIALAIFDRTFAASRLLTAVALAVAAIGLYAALAAMLTAREREFRLLTAIGCSRARIWRLGLAQTTLLGSVAALAALPLGLFMGWVLCAVVQPLAFGWRIALQLDWGVVGYPLLLCVAVAVAAGAVPSYRASFRR